MIDFLPEAESEVEAACLWYENQRQGLGHQFLRAFDAVLARASDNPRAFPTVAGRTRKALIRRFPYLVFFVVEERRLLITGVFHGHRNPGTWSDRVRQRATLYGTRYQQIAETTVLAESLRV